MTRRAALIIGILLVALAPAMVCLTLAGCETQAADKPVLYAFTSATCQPCQMDKPWLDAIRNLKFASVLVVDTDSDIATTQAFGITKLPTYVFVIRGYRYEAGHSAQAVYNSLVNARGGQ